MRRLCGLTKNPEDYGVIVASNLFGDVISDAFAGLVGGLGFAASGNIGDEVRGVPSRRTDRRRNMQNWIRRLLTPLR